MTHNSSDWKACNRHKRFPSSNLGHSANKRRHSDFFCKDNKSIKASKKVAIWARKTAKQPQKMRKVRVSLYFGRSFDKNGTAPLCIAVNHASSSCYTWASLALGIDTPIEVISQALGHTYGMAVTLGYIVPDRRKVDEANRKVLAEVLKT